MKFHLLTMLAPIFIFAAFAAGNISLTEASGNKLLITRASSVLPVPVPTTPAIIVFDTYSNLSAKEEQVRLRKLAAELEKKEFEYATACIISYAGQRTSAGEALKRAAQAKRYLVKNQKLNPYRIYLRDYKVRKRFWTIELIIVPPGASC